MVPGSPFGLERLAARPVAKRGAWLPSPVARHAGHTTILLMESALLLKAFHAVGEATRLPERSVIYRMLPIEMSRFPQKILSRRQQP